MEDDHELAHASVAMKASDQNSFGERKLRDRDEADLVRLGKKPVLKVSSILIQQLTLGPTNLFAAQIQVPIFTGLQLYNSHYVGGHVDVNLDHPNLLGPS